MKWKSLGSKYESQLDKVRAQNPYERLGIQHGATLAEAKKAYKQKIRLYHPDKTGEFMSGHGEEISKLLNEAVEKIKKEIG